MKTWAALKKVPFAYLLKCKEIWFLDLKSARNVQCFISYHSEFWNFGFTSNKLSMLHFLLSRTLNFEVWTSNMESLRPVSLLFVHRSWMVEPACSTFWRQHLTITSMTRQQWAERYITAYSGIFRYRSSACLDMRWTKGHLAVLFPNSLKNVFVQYVCAAFSVTMTILSTHLRIYTK